MAPQATGRETSTATWRKRQPSTGCAVKWGWEWTKKPQEAFWKATRAHRELREWFLGIKPHHRRQVGEDGLSEPWESWDSVKSVLWHLWECKVKQHSRSPSSTNEGTAQMASSLIFCTEFTVHYKHGELSSGTGIQVLGHSWCGSRIRDSVGPCEIAFTSVY